MHHSVGSYLERRTIKELDEILRYCLAGDRWKEYGDAVLEILRILMEREKDCIADIPPEVQAAWSDDRSI